MRKHLIVVIGMALIFAACGGGGTAATTAEAPTTTTSAATTTMAETTTSTVGPATTSTTAQPAPTLPTTGVSAVLTEAYFTTGDFDAAAMGFGPGDVTAEWFRAEGYYVVLYRGIDTTATGPLCPGASIADATGSFAFVSNAPTNGADCTSFITLTDQSDVRALECNGAVAYRTAIPDTEEGFLFGTMERPIGDGIMGITSFVSTEAGEIPEVATSLLEC